MSHTTSSAPPVAKEPRRIGPEMRRPRYQQPAPPGDGGWMAWLQVSAAFALYWNSLGLLNGFGAFQAFYERSLLADQTSSAISWVGSVQVFFLMSGGVIFGPVYDLGYVRSMLAAGTLLVTLGFMMTSMSKEYYQVLLAQGFCIGIGTSCLYIPAIAIVPAYFTTRRALAMGIATVGSSGGATIYPILFEALQPKIGFEWATRIIGFISLALCGYALIVVQPKTNFGGSSVLKGVKLSSPKEVAEVAGLLDSRYLTQSVAVFFSNLSFFVPLYYIQSYARSRGMENGDLAKYLLVILNSAAIPGRIIPSFAADVFGVVNVYIGVCALTAASSFYWISATDQAGNVAFAVLYGFFSGSVITLAPVVLTSITDDPSILGTRLGVVALLKGIASLVGPPIAGAILGTTDSYLGVQVFTGLAMSLTSTLAGLLRIVIHRHRKRMEERGVGSQDPEELVSRSSVLRERHTR